MTLQDSFTLAVQHHQAGRLGDAEVIYRQILAVEPRHPDALHLLGVVAHQVGRNDVAVDLIRQAVRENPSLSAAFSNLGIALKATGQIDAALEAYRRALLLDPEDALAHCNLGKALRDLGRFEEAIVECRRAVELDPGLADAHNNLGNALKERGQLEDAMSAYRLAIQLRPGFAQAHNNLGVALRDKGQPDEAIVALRQAIALKPDFAEALGNLGNALRDIGRLDEAVEVYRRGLAHRPDFAEAHSNLLHSLHYHPGFDAAAIAAEHQRWSQWHADPLRRFITPHRNNRDPERRLRVGYVSPDFWHHVVCHFLIPLLEGHDSTGFEIYCYASVARSDAITERMRQRAAVWRDIFGLQDEALAEVIRGDQIDILVDLSQHTAGNRLLMFARKPAPVQVAWVGFPGSTGLEAMDYRLTDALMEPEGAAWSWSVEKPVRLPDCWFCFDPIDEYPEPTPLPALAAGHVTFGSFNNFGKIHDGVLELWARVLQSVAGSRLLLQCPLGATQARVRRLFEERGIAPERLEMVARTATRAEFLQRFARIDLALETFPYNGGTTTCEALWMGVPVPTFPGRTAISRLGLSMLSAAGMTELIAASAEEYVRLIASLAADLPRLDALRATLRPRMKSSAFMDGPRFARNVEQAYREMWRSWCASPREPS